MQRLHLASPLRLFAGAVLELTPAQALPRAAAVRLVGEGVYEVQTSVQFKAGEVIGYAGELPKGLAHVLVAPPPAEPPPAPPAATTRPPGARRPSTARPAAPPAAADQ